MILNFNLGESSTDYNALPTSFKQQWEQQDKAENPTNLIVVATHLSRSASSKIMAAFFPPSYKLNENKNPTAIKVYYSASLQSVN